MPVTRTLNPLPLGDLEPHRFEDLVRQLAHGFRRWKYLDATGKLGNDGGVDIRGVEVRSTFGAEPVNVDDLDDGDAAVADDDTVPVDPTDERLWLISCKRYKTITPAQIEDIVKETLKPGGEVPYGYILAAPCDISADSMARARSVALTFGVQEVHLWTNGHIEDLLFLPQNDGLLFAYFNISLRMKRSSQLTVLRRTLALKAKLLKIFGMDEPGQVVRHRIVIHDIDDEAYPYFENVPGFFTKPFPSWHPAEVFIVGGKGIVVKLLEWAGIEYPHLEDSKWARFPDVAARYPHPNSHQGNKYWKEYVAGMNQGRPEPDYRDIPESYRRRVYDLVGLPYANILEVDQRGDERNPCVHLYCRFVDRERGPYAIQGKEIRRSLTMRQEHGREKAVSQENETTFEDVMTLIIQHEATIENAE
ncbi:MAG: hypothetical protein ACRDHN_08100 [Thermomicrobiales bacterium]